MEVTVNREAGTATAGGAEYALSPSERVPGLMHVRRRGRMIGAVHADGALVTSRKTEWHLPALRAIARAWFDAPAGAGEGGT